MQFNTLRMLFLCSNEENNSFVSDRNLSTTCDGDLILVMNHGTIIASSLTDNLIDV